VISIIPQQMPTGQDSDPDMDEALRRVRQQPAPRPVSALPEPGVAEASVLLALEIDLLMMPSLQDIVYDYRLARVRREAVADPQSPELDPLIAWIGEEIEKEDDRAGERDGYEDEPEAGIVTEIVTEFVAALGLASGSGRMDGTWQCPWCSARDTNPTFCNSCNKTK
jgi:hypothetical protein